MGVGWLFLCFMDLAKLSLLQEELAKKVILPNEKKEIYKAKDGDIVLSLDIQYVDEKAYVAGDWQYLGGTHIITTVAECTVTFPYYPAFFCFREGPPLFQFLQKALDAQLPTPHVIVVDGHGQAHPRRFGVASWLGIHADLPCVGCAKDSLLWYEKELLGEEKNSFLEIFLEEDYFNPTKKPVGYALRTQTNIKPIFVSNAHKISLAQSLAIIQKLKSEYRIPEPLRRADFACREASKAQMPKVWSWI